jgi:hypothetical protein
MRFARPERRVQAIRWDTASRGVRYAGRALRRANPKTRRDFDVLSAVETLAVGLAVIIPELAQPVEPEVAAKPLRHRSRVRRRLRHGDGLELHPPRRRGVEANGDGPRTSTSDDFSAVVESYDR